MSSILSLGLISAADRALIKLALQEDLSMPFQDVTTANLFKDQTTIGRVKIISKHPEPIVMCGLPVVQTLLESFTSHFVLRHIAAEGATVNTGEVLLRIEAPAYVLLMAERTILNFLQRLCAVATLTAKFVQAVQGTALKILDTRKTTPGMRHLEKYAVTCGGGVNHRMGLYDAIMVKDTHSALLGGIDKVLAALDEQLKEKYPVIIEVTSKQELEQVLKMGRNKVTRVLLDNMSLSELTACAALCKGIFQTEASGNISLENVYAIAQTGVDFASIGKLTHSAGSVDLSMQGDTQ